MLHVLLVEDDDTTRQAIADSLEKAGHRVTQACDGAEALSLALAQSFDVVVCDVQMPRMTGLALLRRLRVERPEWPVFVMTTFGTVADAAHATREGATGYLTKPFDVDAFAQATLAPIEERLRARR
jgi:CheY-like chemotaxis protein